MPLLHSFAKLARGENVTPAHIFDCPDERLIAQGRIILCAASLLSIYLDPTLPIRSGTAAHGVVIAYTALAIAFVALRVWRLPGSAAGYLIHGLDIACLAALLVLTDGRTSSFFAFFTLFILLASTVRWDWQGGVATTALLAVIFLAASVMQVAHPSTPDGYGSSNTVVRGIYLVLTGAFLAYLTAQRSRRRGQMVMLANWPAPDPAQMNALSLADYLKHTARSFEVSRVIVLWEEEEEPHLNIATWENGSYRHTREMAEAFGSVITSQNYADATFWTNDGASRFLLMPDGPIRLESPILDARFTRAFQIQSVGTAPFVGNLCKGRVFILDTASWSNFQLLMVQVVASRIGNQLDRQIMQLQAKEAAAVKERTGLIRDLHDGILQSLTAASLQLSLLSAGDSKDAQGRIQTVQKLLAGEQARIRRFVRAILPRSFSGRDVGLAESLRPTVNETARQWACQTSLSVDPQEATVSAAVSDQLSLMLAEAVANAARHGKACRGRSHKENESLSRRQHPRQW
jgi:signal transduction histidine kinase